MVGVHNGQAHASPNVGIFIHTVTSNDEHRSNTLDAGGPSTGAPFNTAQTARDTLSKTKRERRKSTNDDILTNGRYGQPRPESTRRRPSTNPGRTEKGAVGEE